MAIYAFIGFLDGGGMVPFVVVPGGKFQDIPRAELYTISTSLAALFENEDHAPGNLNLVTVKWNSPECHGSFLRYTKMAFRCNALY